LRSERNPSDTPNCEVEVQRAASISMHNCNAQNCQLPGTHPFWGGAGRGPPRGCQPAGARESARSSGGAAARVTAAHPVGNGDQAAMPYPDHTERHRQQNGAVQQPRSVWTGIDPARMRTLRYVTPWAPRTGPCPPEFYVTAFPWNLNNAHEPPVGGVKTCSFEIEVGWGNRQYSASAFLFLHIWGGDPNSPTSHMSPQPIPDKTYMRPGIHDPFLRAAAPPDPAKGPVRTLSPPPPTPIIGAGRHGAESRQV